MALHGKSGNVTGFGFTLGIHTWTIDYICDTEEDTDFAAAALDEFKTFIAGLSSWTGSINVYTEIGAIATWDLPGATVAAIFHWSIAPLALHNLAGDVIVTGWSPGTPVGGIETMDLSFQGTGALGVT